MNRRIWPLFVVAMSLCIAAPHVPSDFQWPSRIVGWVLITMWLLLVWSAPSAPPRERSDNSIAFTACTTADVPDTGFRMSLYANTFTDCKTQNMAAADAH